MNDKYSTTEGKTSEKLSDEAMLSAQWKNIDWHKAEREVNRLQIRIVKATQQKDYNAVKRLQYLLTHSFYAKALAVKRVVTNDGRRTPGVDGVLWNTPAKKMAAALSLTDKRYRARPLRRVYIEKKDKKKKRPLGIPTMYDRAMQALYALALEPVAETTADGKSFGFRKGRCAQDACEYLFNALSRKHISPKWVLEGDIKGCFDHISHDWLLANISMDKNILKQFLKAGFIYQRELFPTEEGTPQGGIISPILANMTLDGIEKKLVERFHTNALGKVDSRFKNAHKVNFVRYADDFVVTAATPELALEAKELIREFLAERGLELSDEKTVVTNIDDGFDFLGWNFRKYNEKLIIKPSQKAVKAIVSNISDTILRRGKAWQQDVLIMKLNEQIRGWTNYHQSVCASDAFAHLDYILYELLWRWAKRRHPKKNKWWISTRYWHRVGNRNWVFSTENKELIRVDSTAIVRHTKMQDIEKRNVNCIIVKDLSRFGRDYIETGSYLETIFPMLHVRFIAINDDFDNIRQSDVDSLAVPIKNMVNSLYAKDISKKISLSYQMRREKGIPTSWCTPYGYQLNQQGNKFEATEDAKWVKLIYQWYLAGVSTNEIARRLEFLEVARPNERLNRKLHEGDDPTYNKWHPSTVLRILNSSAYIGELVSGKTQTASYKGIGLHPVEKREWHIVENAHEAIILKSDFEKVQARREQNKEKRERAMARSKATREKCYNHLSGMVYCGCCRRNMTFERRVHGTVKETHYGVFICKRKKNTTPCAYHAVPEKMLMMVAMDQIHHLVSTMFEEEKLVKDMMRGSNLDSARSIKMKENSILFRIQEAEERRLRLYEDYKAEILDEDEYSQLKEHYIAEKQRLEHELQKQRQRALELEKRIKICDAQMERMRGILNQNEFDEELVHELIKRIYVGMDNSVEVEFKCSDPYQEGLAIMSEVQNE